MSFIDCLNARCSVYRLQDGTNYDFTNSEEGEVNEVWAIVSMNTKCRVDVDNISVRRRSDGPVDTGSRKIFFDGRTDVRNGDRIYRNGEYGAEQYEVVDATPIYEFDNRIHHREVTAKFTDWTPLDTTVIWVPSGLTPNVIIKRATFDFRDDQKAIAEILLGYWLKSIAIQVIVPFNDADADLSIADSTETLVSTGLVNLALAGNYNEVTISKQYSFNDPVILTLDSGTATQGSGVIFTQVIIN